MPVSIRTIDSTHESFTQFFYYLRKFTANLGIGETRLFNSPKKIKLSKYKPPSKKTCETEASLPKVGCIVQSLNISSETLSIRSRKNKLLTLSDKMKASRCQYKTENKEKFAGVFFPSKSLQMGIINIIIGALKL